MKTTVAVVLVLATLSVAKKSYDGYTVFRITPKTELGKKFVAELAENEELGQHLDFWRMSHTLSDPTDVMVPPRFIGQVEDFLHRRRMEFTVLVENVGDLIQPRLECSLDFRESAFYNCYHTMQEIEEWMDGFSVLNPDLVSKVTVSTTFEGKTVSAVKISSGEGNPAVIFQGGIHAREWISPATMMNFARRFVEDYGVDGDVTQIVDFYDIYIVPVLNKDGYEFTWMENRMWRKNRNTNDGATCMGVDLNRNWNVGFGGPGANAVKCSYLYHGEAALSEPETSGMDAFARGIQESQGVHVFIDFHSYGQYWLWPWGYELCLPPTPDDAMQEAGCMAATKALTSVYGKEYKTYASATMYAASGATEDWAYHTLGAKYSYIVELRPNDDDDDHPGFLLPDSQIEPTGIETFEGVKALLLYTKTDPNPVAQKVEELPQSLC